MTQRQIITEVADRLRTIGRFGDHVAHGRELPERALDVAEDLLRSARRAVAEIKRAA